MLNREKTRDVEHETKFHRNLKSCARHILNGGSGIPRLRRKEEGRLIFTTSEYIVRLNGSLARPRLLVAVAKAYGVNPRTSTYYASIIEIIHNMSLALDDASFFDDAEMRRGRLSAPRMYGDGQVVLSSHHLRSKINLAIKYGPGKEEKKKYISDEIDNTIIKLGSGQEMDTKHRNNMKRLEDFVELNKYKTGSLFSAAMKIGAKLGNASEEALKKLGNCGTQFGVAFQFWDDWKDRFAKEEEIGKSTGLDIKLGKTPFDVATPEEIIKKANKYEKIGYASLSLAEQYDTKKRVRSFQGVRQIFKEIEMAKKPKEFYEIRAY